MTKIDLNIQGMHCGSCALGIQMLTSQMDGMKSSEVSYDAKKGTFEFDESKTNKDAIIKTISELGYQAA
jgi:copper chaperone CopZ